MPWVCPTAYRATKGLRLPSFACSAMQTRWTAILGSAALLHMLNQQERKNEAPRSAHWDSQVHTKQKLDQIFDRDFLWPISVLAMLIFILLLL